MSAHDLFIAFAQKQEGGTPNHSRKMKRITLENGKTVIPDIISDDKYVECEVTTNKHRYQYIKNRKKILYVGIQAMNHFHLVKIYDLETEINQTKFTPLLTIEPIKTPKESTIVADNATLTHDETELQTQNNIWYDQGTELYEINKKIIENKQTIKEANKTLEETEKRITEINKRKTKLTDELTQLAWIKINLGTVTLDPSNTFECCMCDEKATIAVTINSQEYGLCDYHIKKVIGS